jgi:hypothetical protein
MTKRQIIELCQIQISGGDVTADVLTKYPTQTVEKIAEIMFNDLVVNTYKENPNYFRNDLSTFVKRYTDIDILTDSSTGEKYIPLPSKLIQLPHDSAIKCVYSHENSDYPLIYRDNKMDGSYKYLMVGTIVAKKSFYILGNRLYLRNMVVGDLTMYIDIVVPFSAYLSTDEIVLPYDKETFFVDSIVARLLGTLTSDQIEDAKLIRTK